METPSSTDSVKRFLCNVQNHLSDEKKWVTLWSDGVQAMYMELKEQVKLEICDVDHIAITHDSWTSLNNDSYDTITSHFINESRELTTKVDGQLKWMEVTLPRTLRKWWSQPRKHGDFQMIPS